MPSFALIAIIAVVLILILGLLFWKGTGKDCTLKNFSPTDCKDNKQTLTYDVENESSRGGKSCLSLLKEKHPNVTNWKKGSGPILEYVASDVACNNCSLTNPVNKETGSCRGSASSAREEYDFNKQSEYGQCRPGIELPTNTYPNMTYDVSYQIVYVPNKDCDANDVPQDTLRFGFSSGNSTTYQDTTDPTNINVKFYTNDSGKIIGFDVPSGVIICDPTSSTLTNITFGNFASSGINYLLTLDETGKRVYFTKGMALNKDGIIMSNGTYELTIRVNDYSAQSFKFSLDPMGGPAADVTLTLRKISDNSLVGPAITYKLQKAA